jgi:hypothetical protein
MFSRGRRSNLFTLGKSISASASKPAKANSKMGWATIGGQRHYFRSKMERNYCRYLQWLKENGHISNWEYESQTFWFEKIRRGTNNYKPDFKLIELSGKHHWVEVKGYLDSKSKTKLKRFAKYFPDERLELVDVAQYRSIENKLAGLIPDWE